MSNNEIAESYLITEGLITKERYRIDQSNGMEFGIYTLGDHISNPQTGKRISAGQRIHEFIYLAK